jgi:hypothetical protein
MSEPSSPRDRVLEPGMKVGDRVLVEGRVSGIASGGCYVEPNPGEPDEVFVRYGSVRLLPAPREATPADAPDGIEALSEDDSLVHLGYPDAATDEEIVSGFERWLGESSNPDFILIRGHLEALVKTARSGASRAAETPPRETAEQFFAWFEQNYPPDYVLSAPLFHAKRIWQAIRFGTVAGRSPETPAPTPEACGNVAFIGANNRDIPCQLPKGHSGDHKSDRPPHIWLAWLNNDQPTDTGSASPEGQRE